MSSNILIRGDPRGNSDTREATTMMGAEERALASPDTVLSETTFEADMSLEERFKAATPPNKSFTTEEKQDSSRSSRRPSKTVGGDAAGNIYVIDDSNAATLVGSTPDRSPDAETRETYASSDTGHDLNYPKDLSKELNSATKLFAYRERSCCKATEKPR